MQKAGTFRFLLLLVSHRYIIDGEITLRLLDCFVFY